MTTATDIYSLGAVLYKLLTGKSPHQFEDDSSEAIVSAVSSGKITPPSKLESHLRGDLEIILMKALRTEPQARYSSVEQFSVDLENYLKFRPISARKGNVCIGKKISAVILGASGGRYTRHRRTFNRSGAGESRTRLGTAAIRTGSATGKQVV